MKNFLLFVFLCSLGANTLNAEPAFPDKPQHSLAELLNLLGRLHDPEDLDKTAVCSLLKEQQKAKNLPQVQKYIEQECTDQAPEWPDDRNSFTDIWYDAPVCKQENSQTACYYNHSTGRGFFVHRLEGTDHYLACAHTAIFDQHFFRKKTIINTKCRISRAPFANYIDQNKKVVVEPDIKGFLLWHLEEPKLRPLLQPSVLGKQCHTAFADALYCTPTILVMPTERKEVQTVCHLKTKSRHIRAPFVGYSKHKSKWFCKDWDMRKYKPIKKLSDSEKDCMFNEESSMPRKCYLPHIPYFRDYYLYKSIRCNELDTKYGNNICGRSRK